MVLTEMSNDYSNRVLVSQEDHVKQMDKGESQQKDNTLFSSQELSQKLQKENMTLMKALAHRNKIIELSGIEFQKLRINLQRMQEKNLQLAQANSQMLAELNTNRDRLKELQHELGCKNALLKANKRLQVSSKASDGDCKSSHAHDMNHKDTKRKRTSRIKPSGITDDKPIHVNEKANSKRKLSEVIDTTAIPEETCQTEDDNGKVVISRGVNQIVDNVMNKNDLDAANPVKHSKRQPTRRQSTRFDVQQTVQIEQLPEMDDAKECKESARLSLRRQSARLRHEEAEPSFHEGDQNRETIKKRRVSSRKQSTSITDPSSSNNIVQECVHETKTKEKKFEKADEDEEMIRRTSVGRRPSRHAADKVQSYKEVSLKVKMRRTT